MVFLLACKQSHPFCHLTAVSSVSYLLVVLKHMFALVFYTLFCWLDVHSYNQDRCPLIRIRNHIASTGCQIPHSLGIVSCVFSPNDDLMPSFQVRIETYCQTLARTFQSMTASRARTIAGVNHLAPAAWAFYDLIFHFFL